MREHQIIINLKSEHFQELEQMARAAGAKSVSNFLKERILGSLGVRGEQSQSALPGAAELSSVVSDLRRLHRELQVFIAESLAEKDFGYAEPAPVGETVTVSISQAAAAINNDKDGALSNSKGKVAPGQRSAAAVQSNQKISENSAQIASQSSGTTNLVSSMKTPNYAPADSSRELSNAESSPGVSESAVPQDNSPPTLQSKPGRMPPPDYLEELAERAFSISPRLGAIEETDDHALLFSDPLDQLLEELKESEGGATDSQSSEAGQTPSLMPAMPGRIGDEEKLDSDSGGQRAEWTEEGGPGENKEPENKDDAAEKSEDETNQDNNKDVQSAAGSQDTSIQDISDIAGSGNQQNSSPISGGPPPRRRRT